MTDFETGCGKLGENERIDDLGRRGYRILQNKKKFCFGIDATFLAWFAEVRKGEKVIDLCSGTGIVPILMDARNDCGDYTGVEIDPEMVALANRSAKLNGIEDHVRFIEGDLKAADTGLGELSASGLGKLSRIRLGKSVADVVTVNPPYMPTENGLQNPDPFKAAARHEVFCNLDDVIRVSASLLKSGGRFYMVHRPVRLPSILEKMKAYGLSPARICYIHPFADKEATMVLVSGVRGGKTLLKTEAPVIIYQEPGVYTERVIHIYQD